MYHKDVNFLNKIDNSNDDDLNFQSQLENIITKIESHDLGEYFYNLGELYAYKKYKNGDIRFKDYEKFQHYYQVDAFETGASLEYVLKIKHSWMVPKFHSKDSHEELQGNYEDLFTLIKNNFNLIDGKDISCEMHHHDFGRSDDKLESVYCDVKESLQEKEELLSTNENNTSIEE
jgi:hypothetical protein